MKINYVADDGKIFDNEEECLIYENNEKSLRENVVYLDKDLHLINDNNPDFQTQVYFILAKDDFACEALEKKFNEIWIDMPEDGFQPNIIYWWNDGIMAWVNIQEELKELKEKVKFFEDILAMECFS